MVTKTRACPIAEADRAAVRGVADGRLFQYEETRVHFRQFRACQGGLKGGSG